MTGYTRHVKFRAITQSVIVRGGHALFCSGCTIAIRDFQQGHLHVAQLLYLKIFYRATVGSPPFSLLKPLPNTQQ